MKVTVGMLEFPTKKAALDWARQQLATGAPDQDNLLAMLMRHPSAKYKTRAGVSRIVIVRDPVYNTRCFAVESLRGGIVPFSFRECFSATGNRSRIMQALRCEIAEQIADFADGRPGEVDHVDPTFVQLADEWLSLQPCQPATRPGRAGFGTRLANPDSSASWREFHYQNAFLELLTVEAHREKTRRTREPNRKST